MPALQQKSEQQNCMFLNTFGGIRPEPRVWLGPKTCLHNSNLLKSRSWVRVPLGN